MQILCTISLDILNFNVKSTFAKCGKLVIQPFEQNPLSAAFGSGRYLRTQLGSI